MISFLQKYKHLFIGAVVVVVLFFVFNNWIQSSSDVVTIDSLETIQDVIEPEVEQVVDDVPEMIFVEVKGAVQYPGVYELPIDARVKNVLSEAIVLPTGDLLHVNQSMKLKDEMVIYVPFEEEAALMTNSYVNIDASNNTENEVVNINTASLESLMQLNGIGEKTAQAILDYREQNGLFMEKSDLKQVNGIGEKKYLNIEQHIVVN